MPPAQPIPDDIKAQVVQYIRDHAGTPEGSVRAIAAKFGISKTSVGRLAENAGLADAWADGAHQTAAATAIRQITVAQKRAALQERLIDTANHLLDGLDNDVTEAVGTPLGPEKVTLQARPVDKKNTMQAVHFGVSQAVNLARLDADNEGTGQATGLLEKFEASLRKARQERDQQAAE